MPSHPRASRGCPALGASSNSTRDPCRILRRHRRFYETSRKIFFWPAAASHHPYRQPAARPTRRIVTRMQIAGGGKRFLSETFRVNDASRARRSYQPPNAGVQQMPRRRRSSLLLAVSLIPLALSLGGCATRKESAPAGGGPTAALPAAATEDFEKTTLTGARGGMLKLGDLGSGAKTFNLLVAKETSSTGVVGPMFDGLVTREADTLEMKPALAKSWDTSPDGKTWTFHLRRGLRWSDGQPLTADDVL